MYDLANESMSSWQAKYINYHDKKVFYDIIPEEKLVYMYLPRKSRKKLSLKWHGPCKILTQKHPVYEIEYTRMNKKCRKWITRDKLRRCENNVVYQDINVDTPIEKENFVAKDDENVYIFKHLDDENSDVNVRRYPIRRNINAPDRYGNPMLI